MSAEDAKKPGIRLSHVALALLLLVVGAAVLIVFRSWLSADEVSSHSCWTLKRNPEVPSDGVVSTTPSLEDLEANQDYPPPASFNRARVQKLLDDWNRMASSAP